MDFRIILRYARKRVMERLEQNPDVKLKLKMDGKQVEVSFAEMLQTIDYYTAADETNRLKIIDTCNNCKSWTGGTKAKNGCCFPKDYTSTRVNDDYCSLHKRRDAESEREHPWTKKKPE